MGTFWQIGDIMTNTFKLWLLSLFYHSSTTKWSWNADARRSNAPSSKLPYERKFCVVFRFKSIFVGFWKRFQTPEYGEESRNARKKINDHILTRQDETQSRPPASEIFFSFPSRLLFYEISRNRILMIF